MTKFDKTNLPSRHVTEGPARAPHRSYLYAMGLSEDEIHQPLVGVATCWNEAAPCNISLNRQAQAAKMGRARFQLAQTTENMEEDLLSRITGLCIFLEPVEIWSARSPKVVTSSACRTDTTFEWA